MDLLLDKIKKLIFNLMEIFVINIKATFLYYGLIEDVKKDLGFDLQ